MELNEAQSRYFDRWDIKAKRCSDVELLKEYRDAVEQHYITKRHGILRLRVFALERELWSRMGNSIVGYHYITTEKLDA